MLKMNSCEESHQKKNSVYINNNNNNNNNFDMEQKTCSSNSADERQNEEGIQGFNEIEDADSDENQFVNLSDSFDVSDDDVQLSSPSNSLNSDVDQRWYAFRGRWGVNNVMMLDNNDEIDNLHLENHLVIENNQPQAQQQQQQPQDEEETDFLEMDFEPDTNSEIENEAIPTLPNVSSNTNSFIFHPVLPQPDFRLTNLPQIIQLPPLGDDNIESYSAPINRNTGAKPKQSSLSSVRPQKSAKHISEGDNVFRISSINSNNNSNNGNVPPSSLCHPLSIYNSSHCEEVYNLGASSSRTSTQNAHTSCESFSHDLSFMKIHKSPSKASSHHHHHHKHQRLHEEQNDQFLYEIEPLKSRNSVTIYTTNCDEKILCDALTSLNLQPNRDIIQAYFNRSKPSSIGIASTEACELNLVDYVIYKSKLNCNYNKLIDLIKKASKCEDEDGYNDKNFEINFYPLDLFSTTPEMIEVPVDEIVQRWTPLTDLSPLVNVRNKNFYQTNVLGKIVNIIRKINQKPLASFKEKETIRIPQFYVSGYITITMLDQGFKAT